MVDYGSMLFAAVVGSCAILVSLYLLLPALGLPKLDFTAITGGWVGATGQYAKLVGSAVFVLGGIAWAFIYARFFPVHNLAGGMLFSLIPFGFASISVMPELNRFRIMLAPMPGFIWVRQGGPTAMAANLTSHLLFGLCLGLFY